MKNKENLAKLICEVAIMAALGFVLDLLGGTISRPIFPVGGSISFAMLPVLLLAFRRGFFCALSCGIVISLLGMATGIYVLPAPGWKMVIQVLFDYVFTYPLVAFAALFRPQVLKNQKGSTVFLIIGCVVGGLLKFLSQFIGGCIFWADPANFAWHQFDSVPYLYCFLYNFAYTGPSIVICTLVMVALFKKVPFLILESNRIYKGKEEKKEGK